jgi:hypothetical protein
MIFDDVKRILSGDETVAIDYFKVNGGVSLAFLIFVLLYHNNAHFYP